MKKNKAMTQEIWKNINFVPEDIEGIPSSHKISEKHNERGVLYI